LPGSIEIRPFSLAPLSLFSYNLTLTSSLSSRLMIEGERFSGLFEKKIEHPSLPNFF